jgi:hypothetical protein
LDGLTDDVLCLRFIVAQPQRPFKPLPLGLPAAEGRNQTLVAGGTRSGSQDHCEFVIPVIASGMQMRSLRSGAYVPTPQSPRFSDQ